ncbi:hypothetical protein ACH5RR_018561 [Cinchona calisaya]|uniref:Uncharacterized protein n=1 Tax=Cinchona calisaya TaxID=153742 RepID=A0ABD2ZQH9_9GENT
MRVVRNNDKRRAETKIEDDEGHHMILPPAMVATATTPITGSLKPVNNPSGKTVPRACYAAPQLQEEVVTAASEMVAASSTRFASSKAVCNDKKGITSARGAVPTIDGHSMSVEDENVAVPADKDMSATMQCLHNCGFFSFYNWFRSFKYLLIR